MKSLALAGALVLALTAVAFADTSTTVTVPWGDGVNAVLGEISAALGVVLLALLTWAVRFLPPIAQAFVTQARIQQVEQILEKAIDYAINVAEKDVAGKTITLDVKNQLVEQALQYVIDHGPQKLIDWMGGLDAIRQKIMARLPLPAIPGVTTAAS